MPFKRAMGRSALTLGQINHSVDGVGMLKRARAHSHGDVLVLAELECTGRGHKTHTVWW